MPDVTPRRNRVTPLGELVADPARGLVFGNRGCLHDENGELRRDWQVKRWIACRLEFKGRRRPLLRPGRYTELFFLDEATALAAGHRPCAECRRADYDLLVEVMGGLRADEIDERLHAERLDGRARRLHEARFDELPDGAFLLQDGRAKLVLADRLLAWTPSGYAGPGPRPGGRAQAITPPSLLALLRTGREPLVPLLHPSALGTGRPAHCGGKATHYPLWIATRKISDSPLARPELPRAHEYVAEHLRRQISLRLVPPGEAFPPERELAAMLRVARSTVQQAIAILERDGLVERRRGRSGGTFVIGGGSEDGAVSGRMQAVLAPMAATIEEALDFRLDVEPAAAARAAVAATAADRKAVERAVAAAVASRDDETFMRHDTEVHRAIARAAHNRFFVESVERIRAVLNDALAALPESAVWHERSHLEHAAILDALAARDPERARQAMRTHAEGTDAAVRALLVALAGAPA